MQSGGEWCFQVYLRTRVTLTFDLLIHKADRFMPPPCRSLDSCDLDLWSADPQSRSFHATTLRITWLVWPWLLIRWSTKPIISCHHPADHLTRVTLTFDPLIHKADHFMPPPCRSLDSCDLELWSADPQSRSFHATTLRITWLVWPWLLIRWSTKPIFSCLPSFDHLCWLAKKSVNSFSKYCVHKKSRINGRKHARTNIMPLPVSLAWHRHKNARKQLQHW